MEEDHVRHAEHRGGARGRPITDRDAHVSVAADQRPCLSDRRHLVSSSPSCGRVSAPETLNPPPELLLILPIVRISGGRQTSSLISRPWSGEDLLLPVIRWRLRGVVSDVVCSIERRPEGYRFLIHRAGEIEQDEVLRDVRHARTKTQALREVLLSAGFIPVT